MADPVTPVPGTPEHDAAMVAKADQSGVAIAPALDTPAGTPAAPVVAAPTKIERPAYIPEKFWDADKGGVRTEAMAASYAELERARSKPAPAPTKTEPSAAEKAVAAATALKAAAKTPEEHAAADAAVTTAATAKTTEDTAAAAALASKGLDINLFNDEYQANGELSAESYKKLEAAGIPKATVDLYISGQVALAEKTVSDAHALVGGKEAYTAMVTWAGANMTPADRAAFDKAVMGSAAESALAIQGLKARYVAANGSLPTLVNVESPNTQSGDIYRSWAEATTAQKDPRYGRDPAYTQDVIDKIGRSPLGTAHTVN
jgi:hypothetical protein